MCSIGLCISTVLDQLNVCVTYYYDNDNNIKATSVRTTLNNTQNTDAAGRNITTSNALKYLLWMDDNKGNDIDIF
jgi:hypothetical protein